jgi:hypothetical protein
VATTFRVKLGTLAAAAAAAVLTLGLAAPAGAERPGFWSNPSIDSGSPEVGSTLLGNNGSTKCEPGCEPAGPEPSRPGIYYEWVSCNAPTSGGADRPTGGMPDDPRPCAGGVLRQGPTTGANGGNKYTVRGEDAGRWIQLHVIATNYDCGHPRLDGSYECLYSTAHGYSTTIGPVGGSAAAPPPPPAPSAGPLGPPNMTVYPTTSGLAKEGETITSAPGSWSNSPTSYTYQWKRCAAAFEPCSTISGATGSKYVLTADDVGSRVQVLVTASNGKGSNSAASFPTEIVATSAVAPANTALPAITGILEDRQTVTASSGTWTGTDPIAYAYQWLRCNTSLNGCAPIAEATQPTYVLTTEDLASRLVVTVTATNRGGTATATSAVTGHVVNAQPRAGADRLQVEEVDSRLKVASVRVAPTKLRPRGRVVVTVKVTDRRGFLIEGANVRVSGPRGVVGGATASNVNGIAVIRVRAGAKVPKSVVLTVTASKPGDTTATVTKTVRVAVAPR